MRLRYELPCEMRPAARIRKFMRRLSREHWVSPEEYSRLLDLLCAKWSGNPDLTWRRAVIPECLKLGMIAGRPPIWSFESNGTYARIARREVARWSLSSLPEADIMHFLVRARNYENWRTRFQPRE